MRTRTALLVGVALVAATVVPASAAARKPAGYGAFGFTTKGLGATDSYGEPSLAIARDGRHIVSSTPGCGGVCYWYSADGGRSFRATSTQGGGGDSELDFLPDGTLISADLEITDSNIKISKDFGRTWDGGRSAGTEQDRQWLAHSPDGKRLFLAYHDFALEAEMISESDDGGKTWTTLPVQQTFVTGPDQLAAPGIAQTPKQGGSASVLDQGVNTFSGPMIVDPNGKDYYVVYSISDLQSNLDPSQGVPPYGPTRGVVVAHSGDAGKTWTNQYAVVPKGAGTTDESTEGAIFPWGFADQRGTVYVVFDSTRDGGGEHYHQYYTYSRDHGTHWSAPRRLDLGLPVGKGASVYATGAAVKPGVIDVAWYQSDNGAPSDDASIWRPHFAQVTGADTSRPRIASQAVTSIPNHKGGICLQGILCGIGPGSSDRSLLDFFELAVNPRTGLAAIAYADNYRLGGGKGEVVFAQQTAVPRPRR